MPNITALTGDYDAIERAIRETTRGRWFLGCYLERNRSAETRVLLDAIARLEAAMRDGGHMVDALAPAETLGKVVEAVSDARLDITRMVSSEEAPIRLPTPHFAFGSIPRATRAATHAIREAAVAIDKAANALREAGVFQGVAKQISVKTEEIIRACAVQEQSIGQMQRVAMLISDIEGEILAVMDARPAEPSRRIQEEVVEELSLALSELTAITVDAVSAREPA
jgi:hypothetical protein